MGTLISILFSRRLLFLNLYVKSNENVSKDDILWGILVKSTMLTFIALITTETSLILMMVLGVSTIWISIDCMVNCWCIMLMFAVHKPLYFKMCGRLEPLISNKCLLCYSCHCCCKID